MERKLVQQGRNAITVTLPSNWIKKNNLTKEDYVNILEDDNKIIINTTSVPIEQKTKLDLRKSTTQQSYHLLIDKYIQGYDIIEIEYDENQDTKFLQVPLLGMIVENSNINSCILKSIIGKPSDTYENIFKRITQLLLELAKNLEKFAKNDTNKTPSKRDDLQLDEMIMYAMRYVNKYELNSSKDKQKNFLILYSIEYIGDILKNMSFHIKNEEKEAKKIINLIENYIVAIHLKDFQKIYNLTKQEKKELRKETYLDGLIFSLLETISNFLGYILEKN